MVVVHRLDCIHLKSFKKKGNIKIAIFKRKPHEITSIRMAFTIILELVIIKI